jgi:carbonic anhydrase
MKKTIINSLFFFLSITFFNACNYSVKTESAETDAKELVAEHQNCDEVHWSHHKGEDGPENWENLCDGFIACGGNAQSPIDIITEELIEKSDIPALEIQYSSSPTHIFNNGHTVQFGITGENNLLIGDKSYELSQFHFHALSEHTVNGNHYPIEVHFVHRHSDTDFAVIGIMYEEGEENSLLTEYLADFPTEVGEFRSEQSINLKSLVPADLSFYHYSGSLTTPPCSEVVSWYVLKTPLKASKTQIEKFSEILNHNYRPVMPLNGREVFSYAN